MIENSKRTLEDESTWFYVIEDLDLIKEQLLQVEGSNEKDPVFTASPAFNITGQNISRWNNSLQPSALNGYATESWVTSQNYAASADLFSGSYNDLTDTPTLGTAASQDTTAFATAAQGSLADTAVQPGDLSTVATSGDYGDLSNTPTLGTAASADTGDFATAAQGSLADSAVQPGDLAAVATTGAYSDLTGTPTLFSGNYGDLTGVPSTFTPSAHTHNASDINAGTLDVARIPTLPQSKVTDLVSDLASKLTATQGAAVPDSTAEDLTTLVADFNSLLASLRTAGIIAT